MTDDEFEISEEPPRDDRGHPVHPERGHRICGATKSDRTTPTDHGRERDDYEYCLLAAGWGTDRSVGPCSKHPVTGEQWGESNPNFEDGSYSEFHEFVVDDLSEREQEALEALDLDESADEFAKDVVLEAYIKYKRTGDDRFMREARQWASEFGVIEAAPDRIEGEFDVTTEVDVELDEETQDMLDDLTGGV